MMFSKSSINRVLKFIVIQLTVHTYNTGPNGVFKVLQSHSPPPFSTHTPKM